MVSLELVPRVAPGVIGRIVDSDKGGETEAVIILPEKGQVKVLNELGAKVWSLVDGQRSGLEIAHVILGEYKVDFDTVQKDLVDFLEDLITRGAIIV